MKLARRSLHKLKKKIVVVYLLFIRMFRERFKSTATTAETDVPYIFVIERFKFLLFTTIFNLVVMTMT